MAGSVPAGSSGIRTARHRPGVQELDAFQNQEALASPRARLHAQRGSAGPGTSLALGFPGPETLVRDPKGP